MSPLIPVGPRLRNQEFLLLRDHINAYCGIYLPDDSKFLVERRLRDRLVQLGLGSYGEYHSYLREHPDGQTELERAVDILSTNETYFFREPRQLQAFEHEVLPALRELTKFRRRLSIWSAGCSTGEEAYTLAILVHQSGLFEDWDVRIIGSDISRSVLRGVHEGIYRESSYRAMPTKYEDYFVATEGGRQVRPRIRAMCHFANINLLDKAQAASVGRVDAIFCRNVLIYLDLKARQQVVDGFYERLYPGGFLMLGHSESLLHVSTGFELAQLSEDLAYRKPPVRSSEEVGR